MESLADLAFELLSTPAGLAMMAAVAVVTVVLSSGLAACVIERAEGISVRRDSPRVPIASSVKPDSDCWADSAAGDTPIAA